MQHSRWLSFKMKVGLASRGRVPAKKVKPGPREPRVFKQDVGGSIGPTGNLGK